MLFRSVSHGEQSRSNASPEVTRPKRAPSADERGNSASERGRLFDRLTSEFVRRRLPPELPAKHLAQLLRISYRQALDLMNGTAQWTKRHMLALLLRFPDYLHAVLGRFAGDATPRPRFRRLRRGRAA